MKRQTFLIILLLTAALTASCVSGCGKKKEEPAASTEDTPAAEKTGTANAEAPEAGKEANDITENDDTDEFGKEGQTPPEAYPDPNAPRAEDVKVTEESKSEGLNAAPGTVVSLKDNALFGIIGESYSIPEEGAHFTLTMNKIELTDKLTSQQKANRVVRITYTYNNIDLEYLMVGQYSFKMLDKDGKVCGIYYFNPENDDEVNMMPVTAGNAYTAALGFILPDDSDSCTIVYDDLTGNSDAEIAWEMTFEN